MGGCWDGTWREGLATSKPLGGALGRVEADGWGDRVFMEIDNKGIWISHREAAVPPQGNAHGSRCGTWWTVPRKRGAARCWFRRRRTTGSPASVR